MATSGPHQLNPSVPALRCTEVLFAEPDIEFTRRNRLARVALSVTDLALANALSPDLRLERVANECRPGGLSGSGYLVDNPEQSFVDGDLDRLHIGRLA